LRSFERAQELGEVFTNKREVEAMLDLVPDMFLSLDATFLEPACGNGNFLVEILSRKIRLITVERFGGEPGWFEFSLLRALASIFAIDIDQENVDEARSRLFEIVLAAQALQATATSPAFEKAVQKILQTNIILGDSLKSPREIMFIEYVAMEGQKFERNPFFLQQPDMDLFYVSPTPLDKVHYLKLGEEQL
jgi:hypothetical protein